MNRAKIISFIAILGLMVILAGCGSSKSDSKSSTSQPQKAVSNFPDKQITMLVGYAAGGGTDVTARTAVKTLNDSGIVKQTFVVENMPGASGSLALADLQKRKGNPYYLLSVPEFAAPIWKEGGVKATLSDYIPVAQVATDTLIISVKKDSPYKNIDDFLKGLKADPSKIVISISSAIDGGEPYKWQQIARGYGVDKQLNILTTGGASESLTNLLGGHSQVAFVTPALLKGYAAKGDLIPLGILADKRDASFPDIPTMKEKGINVTYYRSRGFWAAAGISPDAVSYWEKAFKDMMETDAWKKYIKDNNLLAEFKGSKEYTAYLQAEGTGYQEYMKTIKKK